MPINIELFHEEKEAAFVYMFNLAFPDFFDQNMDDVDLLTLKNVYTYKASTTTMEDRGYYVFCVSDGSNIRILAAKVNIDDSSDCLNDISEAILPITDFKSYLAKLKSFLDPYIS